MLQSDTDSPDYKEKCRNAVDIGLKYVNNDACYPSLIVVGMMMDAVLSGKYDVNKLAIIMTQTGGGCRALTMLDLSGVPYRKPDILRFLLSL